MEKMNMPRKSVAALSIKVPEPSFDGLKSPASLSKAEATIFNYLVKAAGPKHWRAEDAPLLARYVEAICLAEQAAEGLRKFGAVVDGKVSPWITIQEKAVRNIVALSMRLRLSPQARLDPKTLARDDPNKRPWYLTKNGDADVKPPWA
jgi:phage terminase small subunit